MAVLGRLLVSSAERLDLPDLLSVDSYAAGDWKYFLKGLVGDSKPFILKGFDVIDPGNAIGTQSCSIRVADSVTFYPGSSAGSFFHGLAENHPQAAPLVPELRKNAVNYVYLTFSTFNTSIDTRAFWDPDKDGGDGGEFTQDINTESVLQVQVNVSTGSFPANTVPVAKVTVGPVVITAIEDARDLMFRLGTGGINPNPFNTYAWRSLPNGTYARSEPATTMMAGGVNPFQGADKNILTLKEWMDAIMSKLRELGGTTYWYDDTSSFGIITNFFDAVATAFKSKGKWVHDTVTPGLLTWTEDVQIKMTSDPRTYIIRQGSKQLANEQVMYMAMQRNQLFNSTDENVSWINGQTYINTIGGAVGLFANLSKGDYVKKAADGFANYVRVEEFYDAVNLGGSTTTAAGARSVRISSAYLGTTGNEKGRYDKGAYLASDIIVSDRNQAAIANTGGNFHWLALRSDTIDNVSNIVSHTLSLAISEHDGSTAKVTSTAHGLVDGDRITISGTTNFNGTFRVEVESANIFYINQTGGPFADESGSGFFATVTTSARSTPYGFQEESANHGFASSDNITLSGTTNYNGLFDINVLNATSFTIPISAAFATETAGSATLARIIIRSEGGSVDLIQGQVIDIGGSIADNMRSYIGMDSLSETAPNYAIAPGYNTLDGMQNYNGVVNENLTARISKLSAMMADKAQDKTIRALPSSGITSINNTQNGAAQEITFTPPGGSLTFITPGSDGQAFVALPGTAPGISLLTNQAAYVQIDRNAPSSPSIVVADIVDVPVDENVFLIAVRLLTNDVYLWEGSIIESGGAPGPGFDVTVVKQNQTLKLVEGGDWSWDLGTETVSWSADAFVQIPNLANSVNQIVAGSAVLNAGEVAYVNINRSGVGGALTVNIATNSTLVAGIDTFIIARRETTDVIVGLHSMRLVDGETKKIYAGSSNETLTFIGATGAGDDAPNYTSTTIVSDGQSLVDAISALDAATSGTSSGINQDRLAKLVRGGIWSWNSGTGALVNGASAYMQIAGLLEVRNEIIAQTINLTTDGDAAYVTINRSGVTPATLTVTVAAIASVPTGNDTFIIARRTGTNVIVGNHSMLLVNGESKQLYSGLSDQNLTYIGAATEATSAPTYSSSVRGTAGQSLTARAGVNTDAIGDEQEDRSAYFRSDDVVTWTGSQLEFTSSIVLEILNTKSGTLKVANVLVANSPIVLADGESAYITIDRTLATENVVPTISSSIPAQTQATKDIIVLAHRKDVAGAGYLHIPLHKQVLESGQSVRLGASGSGSGSGDGILSPVPGYKMLISDSFSATAAAENTVYSTFTKATYDAGKKLYRMVCDKAPVVNTNTGTAITITGTPTFTVQVGDILYMTNGPRATQWRRIATVNTQTDFILDAAFSGGDAVNGNTLMLSQAVWTQDLVNFGSATELTRARDFYPAADVNQILVDYTDSLTAGDDVGDFTQTARVVMSASNQGLQAGVTYPTTDLWTSGIYTRPNSPTLIPSYSLLANSDNERLFVVFFCNPNNGTVTAGANLLDYQANFYEESAAINGGVLASAYGTSDNSSTTYNGTISTSGGFTRFDLNFDVSPAADPGGVGAQVSVKVNGQDVPKFVSSVVTPASQLSYTITTDANGLYRRILFSTDLSVSTVDIMVIKQFGVYDASFTQSNKLIGLYDAIVGTASQVTIGAATHTSLQAAHDAVVAGSNILVLNNVTLSGNTSLSKRIMVTGKGPGSVLSGNLTIASGALGSVIKWLKVSGNVTFSAGANKCFMTDCYMTGTFTNDPSNLDNVFEIITE